MSNFVRVYRIEMPDGDGPYCESAVRSFLPQGTPRGSIGYEIELDPHPSVIDDCGISSITRDDSRWYDFYTGCSSLQQLKHWFGEDLVLQVLVESGAYLCVYDVPRRLVKFGSRQVAFLKDEKGVRRKRAFKLRDLLTGVDNFAANQVR